MRRWGLATLCLALPAGAWAATPEIGLRSGEHPGFGRLVLDLPAELGAEAMQSGAQVTVRFSGPATLPAVHLPHAVLGMASAPDGLTLTVAPGVRLRSAHLGDRLLLDLLEPGPAAAAAVPQRPRRVARGATLTLPIDRHDEERQAAAAPAETKALAPEPKMPEIKTAELKTAEPKAAEAKAPEARMPAVAAVVATPASEPHAAEAVATDAPLPGLRTAPVVPVARDAISPPADEAPLRLAASAAPPASPAEPGLVLPFEASTGAAAFRRGEAAMVVFDERRPIDLAPFQRDPVFASAAVQLLPRGTVLSLALPAGRRLRLEHGASGWTVALAAEAAALPRDIVPELAAGMLQLPARGAGQVVSVPDPQTGGMLLVGTQRQGGEAVAVARSTPEFSLLATWQGIAVEPISDAVVVRVVAPPGQPQNLRPVPKPPERKQEGKSTEEKAAGEKVAEAKPGESKPAEAKPHEEHGHEGKAAEAKPTETKSAEAKSTEAKSAEAKSAEPAPAPKPVIPGFAIEGGAGHGLALDAPSADAIVDARAAPFTRRFDFQLDSAPALRRRERAAVAAAGAAPPQARTDKRIAAAQAMLSLGLGPEAQSVLTLAATADGRGVDNPDLLGLSAVAALVAGRPAEATGLDDRRLTGTDEVALWRAVRSAMEHAARDQPDPAAAAVFAANLPLLLAYPPALRDHLLPLAAETMASDPAAGAAAAALLKSRPADTSLDLARAMLQQASDPAAALPLYDRLAAAPDRLASARAAARAVELRLAAGSLTPNQAADALDRQLYAWRGDGRELTLRRRVAALRRAGGDFRAALTLLRETDTLWPEQHAAMQTEMAATFTEALAHDAQHPLAPLDLVALAEDNADLLPSGPAGQALAARLADRLAALDLPKRAAPVLEKLMGQSPMGPARAAFGGSLAAMRLEQRDSAGALAALVASDAPGLAPEQSDPRLFTFARAMAATGQPARAVAALAARDTLPAITLRAELLEAAKDWPGATGALLDAVARSVPAAGPLNPAQASLMLRLASAASQSGDAATLTALREQAPRLPEGRLGELFRLLTAAPVQGVADLARAGRETRLAGALPDALKSMRR